MEPAAIKKKLFLRNFVPKQLFDELGDKKKIMFNGKSLICDKIFHLVSNITTRYYFSESAMMNISSEINREWYGTFYNYYMDYLIHIGFLKVHSKQVQRVKCCTYQLNLSFVKEKEVYRYNNRNGALLKHWNKHYLGLGGRKFGTVRIDSEVMTRLIPDLYAFELDYSASVKYLKQQFHSGKMKDIAYERNMRSASLIHTGEMFHQEDHYGRFHTNFTVLKKHLRNNFLTYKGAIVAETDIRNSQPFFLAVYLKEQGFDLLHPAEYNQFNQVVRDGTIYEQIGNELHTDRDTAKKYMYTVMFGPTKPIRKEHRAFMRLYPRIYSFMATLKELHNNYAVLSHELQRMESNIIFNIICARAYKEIPNIALFTVHDSLFYPQEFKEQVDAIFNEELAKL